MKLAFYFPGLIGALLLFLTPSLVPAQVSGGWVKVPAAGSESVRRPQRERSPARVTPGRDRQEREVTKKSGKKSGGSSSRRASARRLPGRSSSATRTRGPL